MSVILGIDTGGTYTDSVLIDHSTKKVLRKAKSRTTHEDLLKGILASISNLHWNELNEISLVCLSTTMATNSVVERHLGRTGLIYMGSELSGATAADVSIRVPGKLNISGRELQSIDESAVRMCVDEMKDKVDAIAVSGFASVRNPAHELMVKSIIHEQTDLPVVCAHEMSVQLGFFDRTVTAVLNASLIRNITDLIHAVRKALKSLHIEAPCMIVCGDGSLMLDSAAIECPIRTVLSGPAADIAGAKFLTGLSDALVVDMGGTTTDIADLADGDVRVSSDGAIVGGWKTQVRAVHVSTQGIGGDSWIRYDRSGKLQVTGTRVIPLCMSGASSETIKEEWTHYRPPREHEIFHGEVIDCYVPGKISASASYEDRKLFSLLEDGPHSRFYLSDKMGYDYDKMDFSDFIRRGVLQLSSMTPTDILHASGSLSFGNVETAMNAVKEMAYRAVLSTQEFINICSQAVVDRLRTACLQSTADFEESLFNFFSPTVRFILQKEHPLLDIQMTIKKPIVAIGAPVKDWFPKVCDDLNTQLIIPEHAEVANAIGAAVGKIVEKREILIRPDRKYKGYLVYAPDETRKFDSLKSAEEYAKEEVIRYVRSQVKKAGGKVPEIHCSSQVIKSTPYGSGEPYFIEMRVNASATAEPPIKDHM